MSQIINAIPPNALLPVAGVMVGWVSHMLWFRAERAHVTQGMARIRTFMRGNDEWLTTHQQRHGIEPKPVEAELLHVEHATGELPALSDRPAADEDEVGDEQPGEATADAPAKLWQRLREWWSAVWQSRRERNLFGSGEQATDVDPFEQFRIDDSPRGRCHPRTDAEIRAELAELTGELPALPLVLSPAEVAAIDEQRAQWVALNPPTNHGPDGQRHWNDVTAMHDIVTPGRHAKMPINPVPAQRTDGE